MPEPMVWHDEADRLEVWGTLDPPDVCMCKECVLAPAVTRPTDATNGAGVGTEVGDE